jgi:hypothetical protein
VTAERNTSRSIESHSLHIDGRREEEGEPVKKTKIAIFVGYLMAGMTVVWRGIVVSRLAELALMVD